MEKHLFLGDEAIAQAAIDAGLSGVYAYPGTPSTEITEYIQSSPVAKERGIHSRWCANEKTAMEAALGMSYAGKRSLCCMKHVGIRRRPLDALVAERTRQPRLRKLRDDSDARALEPAGSLRYGLSRLRTFRAVGLSYPAPHHDTHGTLARRSRYAGIETAEPDALPRRRAATLYPPPCLGPQTLPSPDCGTDGHRRGVGKFPLQYIL